MHQPVLLHYNRNCIVMLLLAWGSLEKKTTDQAKKYNEIIDEFSNQVLIIYNILTKYLLECIIFSRI